MVEQREQHPSRQAVVLKAFPWAGLESVAACGAGAAGAAAAAAPGAGAEAAAAPAAASGWAWTGSEAAPAPPSDGPWAGAAAPAPPLQQQQGTTVRHAPRTGQTATEMSLAQARTDGTPSP